MHRGWVGNGLGSGRCGLVECHDGWDNAVLRVKCSALSWVTPASGVLRAAVPVIRLMSEGGVGPREGRTPMNLYGDGTGGGWKVSPSWV
jgi:hypothetical protein